MMFEWDEEKRLLNLQKHAIDFVDAQSVFAIERIYSYPSPRGDEARWVTVGPVENRLIAVVWTERGDAVRLISARKARHEEERHYRKIFG